MKRIIDGVTYNTDTAAIVAILDWTEEEGYGTPKIDHREVLYVTKGGAFFEVATRTFPQKNRSGDWERTEKTEFQAIPRDKAQEWILQNGVEIVDEAVLGEPPEAEAEETKNSTLYIRLPASLKNRIEKGAEDENLSVNSWMMRCVEKCAHLDRVGEMLGEIMQTVLAYQSGSTSEIGDMIDHIGEVSEDIAKALGWSGKDLEDLRNNAGVDANIGLKFHRRWLHDDELSN